MTNGNNDTFIKILTTYIEVPFVSTWYQVYMFRFNVRVIYELSN